MDTNNKGRVNMKCPNCDDGMVTVVYTGVKWVEFYIDDIDIHTSIYIGEIVDFDLDHAEVELECSTTGCSVSIDDLVKDK
jgi:hypothetical protein